MADKWMEWELELEQRAALLETKHAIVSWLGDGAEGFLKVVLPDALEYEYWSETRPQWETKTLYGLPIWDDTAVVGALDCPNNTIFWNRRTGFYRALQSRSAYYTYHRPMPLLIFEDVFEPNPIEEMRDQAIARATMRVMEPSFFTENEERFQDAALSKHHAKDAEILDVAGYFLASPQSVDEWFLEKLKDEGAFHQTSGFDALGPLAAHDPDQAAELAYELVLEELLSSASALHLLDKWRRVKIMLAEHPEQIRQNEAHWDRIDRELHALAAKKAQRVRIFENGEISSAWIENLFAPPVTYADPDYIQRHRKRLRKIDEVRWGKDVICMKECDGREE